MGHLVNHDRAYRLLQRRLANKVTGSPESPVFMKILRMLFSPRHAEIAFQVPSELTPVDILAQKTGLPPSELAPLLTDMAQKGLLLDVEHEGKRYYALPPVVIGFFEFTFMRVREDVPMGELARLFEEYLGKEDGLFSRSLFAGSTQLTRTLIQEETLPAEDHSEILDWERASSIVSSATAIGVSLCPCRHTARHLNRGCDRPLDCCLSFNHAAEMVLRNGLARPIDQSEAMAILARCKELQMAQTADNVQRHVAFICNCCTCCCGMLQGIRRMGFPRAIVSSNWIAEPNPPQCTKCGQCAEACPVQALDVRDGSLRFNPEICLGCGICVAACRAGAITMKARAQRTIAPETIFDQIATMAVERGKLSALLFEDPEKLSHRALRRVLGALERSAPTRALLAIEPLRSAFLTHLVKNARKRMLPVSERFR